MHQVEDQESRSSEVAERLDAGPPVCGGVVTSYPSISRLLAQSEGEVGVVPR